MKDWDIQAEKAFLDEKSWKTVELNLDIAHKTPTYEGLVEDQKAGIIPDIMEVVMLEASSPFCSCGMGKEISLEKHPGDCLMHPHVVVIVTDNNDEEHRIKSIYLKPVTSDANSVKDIFFVLVGRGEVLKTCGFTDFEKEEPRFSGDFKTGYCLLDGEELAQGRLVAFPDGSGFFTVQFGNPQVYVKFFTGFAPELFENHEK